MYFTILATALTTSAIVFSRPRYCKPFFASVACLLQFCAKGWSVAGWLLVIAPERLSVAIDIAAVTVATSGRVSAIGGAVLLLAG